MKCIATMYLTVLGMILFHPDQSRAQWVQTNGPRSSGAWVFSFGGNDSILFAGVVLPDFIGICRSNDHGGSWTRIAGSLPGPALGGLALIGSNLFAGTERGTFVSGNYGVSWTQANSGLTDTNVTCLAVSPDGSSERDLFAGTHSGGLFRSTDQAATWSSIGNGLPTYPIYSLVIDGSNIYAGTLGGGLFKSTNAGVSWDSANIGLASDFVLSLLIRRDSSVKMFIGTCGGLFRSTDTAASWEPVGAGLTVDTVTSLAMDNGNLFAATFGRGVFRSIDDGANWKPINTGLQSTMIRCIAVSGEDLVAGTFGSGIFHSSDMGDSWTSVLGGDPSTRVQTLLVNGSYLFAGTNGDGAFRSMNAGVSWDAINAGFTYTNEIVNALVAVPALSETLIAGCSNGAFTSTDNGTHWILADSGLTNTFVNALAVSGRHVFAGTNGGVFLSTDNGSSWSPADSGLPPWGVDVFSLAVSGSSVFAGTGGGVYRSTDSGVSWTVANQGIPISSSISCFGLNGSDLLAGTWGHGAFLSTDGGKSWNPVDTGLTNTNVEAFVINGTDIFAATDGGVFRSTNDGARWTLYDTGLGNTHVLALAVNDTDLFAGTWGSGVWKRPLSDLVGSVHSSSDQLPPVFTLGQNYPNPFNPTTQVSYSVPKQSYVILKIYDVLGREIATLVNEKKQAGEYTVKWNAGSVSSGVYFYRLVAGDFVQTRKMILTR